MIFNKKSGIYCKDIILPKNLDMTAWSVVACDQFTSENEFWDNLKDFVGDKKSTLNLILPEIYLKDNAQKRIKQINQNIDDYIKEDIFETLKNGFVLTVRKTPFVERRIGLVGAVDLEEYDYKVGSESLVRATEGTIEERIPPRLEIRKSAKAEFSHIMVLFDDEKREINEKLFENKDKYQKLYDFDLNMGGGHIEGYFIPNSKQLKKKFDGLLNKNRLKEKYGAYDKFQFAVGDGNHSLATAKTHWENIKKTLNKKQIKNHPARYAVAEFVNIYDEGIYFEPIFRFVKGVDKKDFINGLKKSDLGNVRIFDGEKTISQKGNNSLPDGLKNMDAYIKQYISEKGGSVDYIHGEENIKKLVKDNIEDSVAILCEKLDKSELFKYCSKNGALPRKTFSMGENVEKRYYLEGSIISND